MFIELTRVDSQRPSTTSQIIVKKDDVLMISTDDVRNFETQAQYSPTRVDITGTYVLYTLATVDAIAAVLGVNDVTAGVNPAPTCENPTDRVFPVAAYPFIKLAVVHNLSSTETEEAVINPNHIVWAETSFYLDRVTKQQQTALLITLRDSTPRRVLSKLSFADLQTLLSPTRIYS